MPDTLSLQQLSECGECGGFSSDKTSAITNSRKFTTNTTSQNLLQTIRKILSSQEPNQQPTFSQLSLEKQTNIEKQLSDATEQLTEQHQQSREKNTKRVCVVLEKSVKSKVPVETDTVQIPSDISKLPQGLKKLNKTTAFLLKKTTSSSSLKQSAQPLNLNQLANEDIATQTNALSSNLESKKNTLWQNCITNKNKKNVHKTSAEVKSTEANTANKPENLSVQEKKELLPFSSLWTTPITQLFSHKATGLSHDYEITTTPKNDGMGICKRDDPNAMNLWSTESYRAVPGPSQEGEAVLSINTTNNVDSSNSKKRIFAGLRSAAWIPTSGKWGSTLERLWIRYKTCGGGDNPLGEQRLQDTMKAVLELQAGDPKSAAYKAINHQPAGSSEPNSSPPGSSQENPLSLSMFSNSLVSGCVIGGTDPERYSQDMQLRLIEYANKRKEPFALKVKNSAGTDTLVWVKPDIMMLSSPVQKRDRRLMSWSLGLLGRRNHTSNIEAVDQLEKKYSDYKKEKLEELNALAKDKNKQQEACELALNIKADQALMDEIIEMKNKPKDLKSGMYGSNYGNPHAFNARMAVLASRMGITPITNCKTGKDRTEDSLVAQQLLAAEIDDNIQREIKKQKEEDVTSAFLNSIINNKRILLVPRRDFLSAENLKKEIQKSAANGINKVIDDVIKNYYLKKISQQNNLHITMNSYAKAAEAPISDDTHKILDAFERTANRRMAFSLSEAGFTIQMLNNKIEEKKELIWGNKQPRYPNYFFGLSKNLIDAYTNFMKPVVPVGA